MFKPLSKVLVVVAMLTAFVGQALAYTSMSCEMSADSHQSHMTMEHSSMKSHEGMEHGDMKASASSSKDCCDVDCICPANACSSTTVLNSSIDSTDIQIFSESVAALQSKQPHSISTSLYRPPIFA
jgi:pyruvate/2-oxoglutarate/acetoin dehydrogenase E1 component